MWYFLGGVSAAQPANANDSTVVIVIGVRFITMILPIVVP